MWIPAKSIDPAIILIGLVELALEGKPSFFKPMGLMVYSELLPHCWWRSP